MKIVKLYSIRNWVRGLSPLYISICAALLLELKFNVKLGTASFLYFTALICFGLASIISNILSNRCNDCGRIYDIKINIYEQDPKKYQKPVLESIYENRENRYSRKNRIFHHYGVFVFGLLGLLGVILSYSYSDHIPDSTIKLEEQPPQKPVGEIPKTIPMIENDLGIQITDSDCDSVPNL